MKALAFLKSVTLKKAAFILMVAAIALSAHAYRFNEHIIPEYKPDDHAIYVYGIDEKNKHHLFSSDGQYCYISSADNAIKSVAGQWVRRGDNIHINYQIPQRTFFALWHNWDHNEVPLIDMEDLIIPHAFNHQPFLLGFGDDTPTQLAIFDPKIHNTKQPIITEAKNVFVGENIKYKDGYALTAFSLENLDKIKQHQGGEGYALSLATTANTLSADEIAKRPTVFAIHHDGRLLLDDVPTYSYVSDDTNSDIIMMSNALAQCQGENPLSSLYQFYKDIADIPQKEAIIPLMIPQSHTIKYQGNIEQNATWLQPLP